MRVVVVLDDVVVVAAAVVAAMEELEWLSETQQLQNGCEEQREDVPPWEYHHHFPWKHTNVGVEAVPSPLI